MTNLTDGKKDGTSELERYFFYRLIRVMYFVSLLISVLFVFLIGLAAKPEKYVENNNSYLVCNNGSKYLLSDLNIYLYDNTLSDYDKNRALKICEPRDLFKAPYSLELSYKKVGDWWYVFLCWGLGLIIAFILLNILRETLVYLTFGKAFSWIWLQKFWY